METGGCHHRYSKPLQTLCCKHAAAITDTSNLDQQCLRQPVAHGKRGRGLFVITAICFLSRHGAPHPLLPKLLCAIVALPSQTSFTLSGRFEWLRRATLVKGALAAER